MEDEARGASEYLLMKKITGREVARLLKIPLENDELTYTRVALVVDAGPEAIVLAITADSLKAALESKAGLILAPASMANVEDSRVLYVQNPKYAFASIARLLEASVQGFIHGSAHVDPASEVGECVSIGAGSVVEADVTIGRRCTIGSNVVIHGGVTLGEDCIVQSGVVLGSTGFGYVRGPDGRYLRFPQQGTLWVGDDVEIGANTTIDRGALGETRIGRGTKIDNLVHIAHNCVIGEDVLIAAQVGIAGSTEVGDGAILAGQVGLAEHVIIGPGVIVGAQAGVPTNKKLNDLGQVFWGTPARPIREYLKDLAALRRRA